ncbi:MULTISPECIES: hypothetical protein [Rhodococcus]|uniref:Secreted protein n=2 Tax=Rhodococcus opacus TaxID=37919 RepID=C1BCZ4_RHOOB|nr:MULTISPECIES: hypothetical protein [Rhodococcus]EID81344.1 hypothetical protein W59_03656 [Rhodococcus opacus RKJ300 = JCM 13270]KAF0958202.1 hypothetical protein MLGJGCBP_08697 [Rhodococcus sp. T7]QQZ19223.1 hypothetical protein GO592_37975 [Rhodococcus sp. 21391]UOT07994.1 hypothetical protein MPY17_37045 [Rhodococcus opacus]BAH55738.1 hypothetical protein ROP_pROB01-02390 [Rhodococcus opacus B4]
MNASSKFAGFTVGLAAVFALALGAGAAFGPEGTTPADTHDTSTHDAGSVSTSDAPAADQRPGGLMVTDSGYTLALDTAQVPAGADVPLRFRILGADGQPVTRYVDSHEKQLHLIAVRRDMAGFQHVHPVLDAAGTWSVPLDLTRAGAYRVFADFTPDGGDGLTLGADLQVAGAYDPQPLPPAAASAVVDGYTVTLGGTLTPGQASKVTLSVSRDGQPVTDLQPYLGAYGHLVALRAADLGYLHVHPDGHPGDGVTTPGPGIDFFVTTPSAGDYRLFLDFQHDGVVRTAEFTLTGGQTPAAVPAAPEPMPAGHGH